MGDGHFSKREDEIGVISGIIGEAVGRADGEKQWRGISLLMSADKRCEFFRGKLFAAGIEKYEETTCSAPIAAAEFQKRSLVFERNTLRIGVLFQAFQIFIGEGLDGGILRFADLRFAVLRFAVLRLADPCDGEFHGIKILTAEIAEISPSSPSKVIRTSLRRKNRE